MDVDAQVAIRTRMLKQQLARNATAAATEVEDAPVCGLR
jgi:hypothetical protein